MTDIYLKAEIKAHYLAGLTYSQIAQRLRVGKSIVAGHIFRMRGELTPRGRQPRGVDKKPRKPKEFKPKSILRPDRIVVHQDVPKYIHVKRKPLTRKELYDELHQAVLNTR